MATIIHFDISAKDPERVKVFYETLFSWKFERTQGPMNYHLIETKDLKGQKGIGGGMAKRDDHGQPGIINYVEVDSIDHSITQVTTLGGKVIQPKQAVPGYGYLAVCLDTEDNLFGLFQEVTQTE